MDPAGRRLDRLDVRLPRTRGDGPRSAMQAPGCTTASPHTRGWTRDAHRRRVGGPGFPAHAGMDPTSRRLDRLDVRLPRTRGDGPWDGWLEIDTDEASPHTRGWTHDVPDRRPQGRGFPAHAGMDPSPDSCSACTARLPRTRGDGPGTIGVSPSSPRASPHTRGWTLLSAPRAGSRSGFPAHAGMDPRYWIDGSQYPGLPRTRGDGPYIRRGNLQVR